MKKRILSSLLLTMLGCCISYSVALAAPGAVINHKFIVEQSGDNPVIERMRHKIRGTQNLSVTGVDGYSFFVNQADSELYKDGSFIWLFIFAKHNSPCRGDIFFEYNASNFKTKVTEFCVLHGVKDVDFEEIPYLERTIGLAHQLCDHVPIKRLGEPTGR